ncbi:MAG: hypothetical protein K6T83_15185 [Alicyclobacillus sp.]|nr:hypothetical protein [Alicyclobacillus sp.]
MKGQTLDYVSSINNVQLQFYVEGDILYFLSEHPDFTRAVPILIREGVFSDSETTNDHSRIGAFQTEFRKSIQIFFSWNQIKPARTGRCFPEQNQKPIDFVYYEANRPPITTNADHRIRPIS